MPTIASKISQKEHDAICEYANLCGQTVSNLIRKVMIAEAMLHGGYSGEHPEYECTIQIPDYIKGMDVDKLMEEKINKFRRRILGWREIKLS